MQESPLVILKVESKPASSFDLSFAFWVSAIVFLVLEGLVIVLLNNMDLPL